MNSIAFIDIEIEPKSRKILDIGSVKDDGSFFHKSSVAEFVRFLSGTHFICGHKFSRQFVNQIELLRQKSYELKSAKVNFIVYWQKEGSNKEVKILLPELYFEKQKNEA